MRSFSANLGVAPEKILRDYIQTLIHNTWSIRDKRIIRGPITFEDAFVYFAGASSEEFSAFILAEQLGTIQSNGHVSIWTIDPETVAAWWTAHKAAKDG